MLVLTSDATATFMAVRSATLGCSAASPSSDEGRSPVARWRDHKEVGEPGMSSFPAASWRRDSPSTAVAISALSLKRIRLMDATAAS